LQFLNEGVNHFPRRPLLLVRTADFNLRHGNPEDARKIITFGLRVLPNSPARLALENLSRELPPEPAVPLSSTPAANAKAAPAAKTPAKPPAKAPAKPPTKASDLLRP
jgi:hypothetical protein